MNMQTALSIVAPNGTRIANGSKSLEIRSWRPGKLPLRNLYIVENQHFLNENYQFDPNGLIVAIVDIYEVHEWQLSEVDLAHATSWSPGYWAWSLENVRPVLMPFSAPARRYLYDVCID